MSIGDPIRFAGAWLSLREPADALARSVRLTEHLARHLANLPDVTVMDLGAGHGSNLRYLGAHLPDRQHWLLIDHDQELLSRVAHDRLPSQSVTIETATADLDELQWANLDRPDLVTASALLDLASEVWVKQLARAMVDWQVPGLFVLNVDGRRHFIDSKGCIIDNNTDRTMAELFNDHQLRDKGLGRALGPSAARVMSATLGKHGFTTELHHSDWRLEAGDRRWLALGCSWLANWQESAHEQAPEQRAMITDWYRQRLKLFTDGKIGMVAGHVDLLALPGGH